jgi:hypothetical protein
MPYEPPPELAAMSLAQVAEAVTARRLPPVSQWEPAQEGDSEMRIAADGRWYHQGGEIRRAAMVRAFASLLRRDDDGQHWLVTPHEKLRIEVEDAPLIATDVTETDGTLVFRLITDEFVLAGPDHPLRAAGDPDTPALYVLARNGCEARLNRSTYTQLADIALQQGEGWSVTSQGASFALVPT